MSPLVIGVGNPLRGDDAVGPLVLQQLAAVRGDLRLAEAWGEGAALMELWSGEESVLIVDAARPAGTPGRTTRIDASTRRIPADMLFLSTHLFGVAEAVETARVLGTLPRHVVLHAVEGLDFTWGAGPTPRVARAIQALAGELARGVGRRSTVERGGTAR